MRRKLVVHATALFIAVFVMSANAFCAGLCAGGHGLHGREATEKGGHEAHSCHHYAPTAANAASSHGHDDEKAKQHVCHVGEHGDDGQSVSANAAKPDKSSPVIECNCMGDPGAFAPETEAPVALGMKPSPALDFVAAAATAEARIVLAEFMLPETPPRNHARTS